MADYHSKGGTARADSLTPERRKEIASRAGRARWEGTPRAEKKAKPETVRLILKLAPELHAWLAETAPRLGITLEQFAAAALDDFRDIATRGGSRPTLREVAADLKRGTPPPVGTKATVRKVTRSRKPIEIDHSRGFLGFDAITNEPLYRR